MILLAVDTTAQVASAALFQNGALLAGQEADATKKHAETVLPMIDLLLEETGVRISDVDVFAVDVGPGSFTGVRIGVSLVNAMAFAIGRKVIAVDALYALYEASGESARPVCAMIDARNGNAYAALYQAGNVLIAPGAVEVEAFLPGVPADAVFVGDLAAKEKTYPHAKYVGLAALSRLQTAGKEAEPLYLRPSQAERMRQKS